jgi:dihydrolipoamide dehydrogenase
MSIVDIKIPDIGGSDDVKVAEIYVKVGDKISVDDNVLMLETEKATMEIPADVAGVVEKILVKVGSKVTVGDTILKIAAVNPVNKEDSPDKTTTLANNVSGELEFDCDVLVIGAGPGGYTAAFRASDLRQKVILIEKHANLGGVCLNVGCIPSKALLHVAKVINEAKAMEKHGVSFGKMKLDIEQIREYKAGIVSKLTGGLRGLAKQRNVEVVFGGAKFVSSNQVVVTGENDKRTIRFKNVIIATGSSSFQLPGVPYEDPRVIDSTGALDLQDIPRNLLIIGGGIIGLEMAEVYSTFGSKVTVVELGDSIIPGADKDLVKVLENRIKKTLHAIKTNTMCTKFESKANGIYVNLKKADTEDTHLFDKVLVCVGRRPNGKEIEADKAGVYVDERGFIPVDKQCRTNVKNIYAIGDVVGQPMLAHKATHEGKVAAENCAGLNTYFDARTIPNVAYTDPEIAWMGVTENEAKEKGFAIEVGKFPWLASGRALANGRDDGFTKIIVDKNSKKIIGAGIVGVNAGELLAETVLALEMGCDVHDVALTIHAHPTLSETIGFACEIIDGSITDIYVPR